MKEHNLKSLQTTKYHLANQLISGSPVSLNGVQLVACTVCSSIHLTSVSERHVSLSTQKTNLLFLLCPENDKIVVVFTIWNW